MSDQEISEHAQEENPIAIDKPQGKLEVCLKGVGKYHKEKQVLKELQQLLGDSLVKIETITKPKMKPFCFVKFSSEEDRDKFIVQVEALPGNKNKKLRIGDVHYSCKYAQKVQREQTYQPQREQRQEQQQLQQTKPSKEFTAQDVINQTAQLHHLSYDEQVKFKVDQLNQMLRNFRKQYVQRLGEDDSTPNWIKNSEEDISKLTSIEDPIICLQAQRLRYRNKSEFTIGFNQKGEPAVGFNMGSYQDNNASIERAPGCIVTPPIALELAEFMETLIERSGLRPYNRNTAEGFWRLFSIRRSERTNQIYLVVGVNKDGLNEEQLQAVIELLKKSFIEKISQSKYTLEGIMLTHSNKKGSDQPSSSEDTILVFGTTYYSEIILGKTFRISYNGFLQNHIEQCDRLYQKVIDLTKISKPTIYTRDPIFLDVCAGSGTIGVTVIAVEMVESSCKDAEVNYQNNKLENCRIICSKVENVMKELSNDLKNNPSGSHFVACLDPPRAGVNNVVVEALRTCKGLDNIIYVSCCPPMIIENLLQLCLPQSKRRRAPGFKIKSVTMVDMFPQTNHYEAIFHLERDYLFA